MADDTFTFRVDEELKTAFAQVASAQERTVAQLLRHLMRQTVTGDQREAQHDAWFSGEVDQALIEADDPSTRRLDHADVRAKWHAQRELLERQATGRTA